MKDKLKIDGREVRGAIDMALIEKLKGQFIGCHHAVEAAG